MDDVEDLRQLLVVIVEPVPGEHEPERVEDCDVESCVHEHGSFCASTLKIINEIFCLHCHLFLHGQSTQAKGSQMTHGESTTLGPRGAVREYDACQNSEIRFFNIF